jgi:hypothetical protein
VTWTGTFVDRVVSVEPFHVSGSVTSVGLSHKVNNIVLHIFILVDVSVVSGVSVGELVGVPAGVVGLHFSELDERLFEVLLVLGEVLDVFPPVTWGDDGRIFFLNLQLEEGVIEWLSSHLVVSFWVGTEVTSADGVDVVLLSEVAWALGPVDASTVLVGDLIIIVSNLDHVSVSLVVVFLLGETMLWVSNSIWVGDPSVMIVVNFINVTKLEWAFSPASTIVLLAHLGLPLIRALLKFFLLFFVFWLDFFWLLGFRWIILSKSLLDTFFSNETVWEVNSVKFLWALGPASTVVLYALSGVPDFLLWLRRFIILLWISVNLS